MEWDLGLWEIAVLLAMSLGFGLVAQLLMWKVTTHRLWVFVAVVCFFTGMFTSELLFGWATEEDLQPNIDGLSFDEVLLSSLLPVLVVMLAAWLVERRSQTKAPRVRA